MVSTSGGGSGGCMYWSRRGILCGGRGGVRVLDGMVHMRVSQCGSAASRGSLSDSHRPSRRESRFLLHSLPDINYMLYNVSPKK